VLRFGFNPEFFRPFNENLAHLAGRVGIPLIGLGFLNLFPESRALIPLSEDLGILFVLSLLYGISLALERGVGELYTTIAGVCSMGAILKYGITNSNNSAMLGVFLFVVGGIVIGPEREKYLMGVRRENLFHYTLGTALLLIGASAPAL
jgi:hypothetical protein